MRIAVDATALYGRYNGVEYALWNLLTALATIDTENNYTVYIPHDGPPPGHLRPFNERWDFVRLPFNGGEKARRIAWQQASLPLQLRRDRCDILHAPTYTMPLLSPVPTVLTVYDLIAVTHPQFATISNRLHYGLALHRSLQRAARIIVPSQSVRDAVARHAPSTAQHTALVPLGVEPLFFQPVSEEAKTEVRARYDLPPRFLLFVGNFEPKKNLRKLLQALNLLPGAPPLVLAGGARAWNSYEVEDGRMAERVQAIGYVRRRDLPVLYALCEAFVFPSLAEGFGLPVLEALASGTAVVTSTAVPLPDLAEATCLCDPNDVSSIAGGISAVLADAALRAGLQQRARLYARPFTWKRTAELTLEVYRSLA